MVEAASVLMCLAAIIASGFADADDRRPALVCSGLLLSTCVLYNAPWYGLGFVQWLNDLRYYGLPIDVPAYETERAARGLIGMTAMFWLARTHIAPWVIWQGLLFLAEICFHFALYVTPALDWHLYERSLNCIFTVQLAIIFAIGGKGLKDACIRHLGNLGLYSWPRPLLAHARVKCPKS